MTFLTPNTLGMTIMGILREIYCRQGWDLIIFDMSYFRATQIWKIIRFLKASIA